MWWGFASISKKLASGSQGRIFFDQRPSDAGSTRPDFASTAPARLATRLAFFAAGFSMACCAPLFPFIKDAVGADKAQFGLLLWPLVLIWRAMSMQAPDAVSPFVGPLSLMLAINVADMIPNATLTPMTWLMAGALTGYAERLRETAPKRRQATAAGHLRRRTAM